MAGRGGARPGGGRPKGSKNKASIAREQEIKASGLTPLDYMLTIMRDEEAPKDVRLDAAKAAAPYVHPKLSSVEMSGGLAISHEDALEQLE